MLRDFILREGTAMMRRTLCVVLAGLAVGVLVGCASPTVEELDSAIVTMMQESPWPGVPCPPEDKIFSARDRLNRIIIWAQRDNRWDVVVLAADCRDIHYYGPNHQEPTDEMSELVFAAWKYARAARFAPDPEVKEQNWLACRNELDHDP